MAEQKKQPASISPEPAHTTGTPKGEERKKKEGKEAGRKDTASTGKAKRHAGKSTGESSTGVNPKAKEPVDPSSPHLQTP